MPDTPPAPETPIDDEAVIAARESRRAVVLARVTEICLNAAEVLERRIAQDEDALAGGELALSLTRVARAVRQTVALGARLDREQRARKDAAAREAASGERAGKAPTPLADIDFSDVRHMIRKDEVLRVVEEVIDETSDGEPAERLYDSLVERLQDDEGALRGGVARDWDRPTGELVADLCHELGLEPDWELWDDEDWAREEAQAREPSHSPYAMDRMRQPAPWEISAEAAGSPPEDARERAPP